VRFTNATLVFVLNVRYSVSDFMILKMNFGLNPLAMGAGSELKIYIILESMG
jgi:hypothetical protein